MQLYARQKTGRQRQPDVRRSALTAGAEGPGEGRGAMGQKGLPASHLAKEQEVAASRGVVCSAFLPTAGQLLSTRRSCKCSLSGGDLGAESAARLSVLLDYQLIRAVKSPLLNNQHGAFWLLCISGRGKEAEQLAWLLLIHE